MINTELCPICNCSLTATYFLFKGDYNVVRCKNCNVQFLWPQPSDATLANIYNSNYFLGSPTIEEKSRVSKIKQATSKVYLNTLSKLLPDKNRTMTLLEMGCGDGDLLVEGHTRNFTVYGIEVSPYAIKTANEKLGSPSVIWGLSENIPIAPNSIDVCVLADVIEHTRTPINVIQQIQTILKPAGLLFIVTPSLNSWSAKLMKSYWMEYKLEHLFYFSNNSMKKLLESNGFSNINIEPNYKVLTFDYIYHHFIRFQVPFFTPLLKILHAMLPSKLMHTHITLVASGMVVTAQKDRL